MFLTIGRKNATGSSPPVQRYMNKKRFADRSISKLIKAEGDNFEWATLTNDSGVYLAYYHCNQPNRPLTLTLFKQEVEIYKDESGTRLCGLIPSYEGRKKGITDIKYVRLPFSTLSALSDYLRTQQPNYFKLQLYEAHKPVGECWINDYGSYCKNL
jgi:hypothetical protein